MSFFDDAQKFMQSHSLPQKNDEKRELVIKKLRAEFENATLQEIEHALDKFEERYGSIPTDFNEFLKKIRIWLED